MSYLPEEKRVFIRTFVSHNYKKMRQREMREQLGVSAMTITRTVRELNLTNKRKSLNYMGASKPEIHHNGFFNVNARWSWLAG